MEDAVIAYIDSLIRGITDYLSEAQGCTKALMDDSRKSLEEERRRMDPLYDMRDSLNMLETMRALSASPMEYAMRISTQETTRQARKQLDEAYEMRTLSEAFSKAVDAGLAQALFEGEWLLDSLTALRQDYTAFKEGLKSIYSDVMDESGLIEFSVFLCAQMQDAPPTTSAEENKQSLLRIVIEDSGGSLEFASNLLSRFKAVVNAPLEPCALPARKEDDWGDLVPHPHIAEGCGGQMSKVSGDAFFEAMSPEAKHQWNDLYVRWKELNPLVKLYFSK